MRECEGCLEKARAHGWPCPRQVLGTLEQCSDATQLAAAVTVAAGLLEWLDNYLRSDIGTNAAIRQLREQQLQMHREALRKTLTEAGIREVK